MISAEFGWGGGSKLTEITLGPQKNLRIMKNVHCMGTTVLQFALGKKS